MSFHSATPLFDPAVFASMPRETPPRGFDSRHAMTRNGASSGLYAASTSTSRERDGEGPRREDTDDDLEDCLDLLDQLELEISRAPVPLRARAADMSRENSATSTASSCHSDLSALYEECRLARPESPRPWRSMYNHTQDEVPFPVRSRSPSPAYPATGRTSRARHRSRRQSGGQADVADLDLDAILAAYDLNGVLPEIEAERGQPMRSPLRPAFSSGTIRPAKSFLARSKSPAPSSSSSSLCSVQSGQDEDVPRRRAAPFPAIPRAKSSTSLRSVARARRSSEAEIPPVPPLPTALQSEAPFARSAGLARFPASTSTSSSLSEISCEFPLPPVPSSTAMRASASHESRSSISSTASSATGSRFEHDSLRWSVGTASTAASSVGGDSPTMKRVVRFDSVDETDEFRELGLQGLPELQEAPFLDRSAPVEQAEERSAPRRADKRGSTAILSFEDFVHELEETAPPSLAQAAEPVAPAPKQVLTPAVGPVSKTDSKSRVRTTSRIAGSLLLKRSITNLRRQ